MSKGSNRRPAAVPPATVAANYERTFEKRTDRYAPRDKRYVPVVMLSVDEARAIWPDTPPPGSGDDAEA